MNTILTIIKDPARARMYEHLARQAGVHVIHAEGALHALTQLERTPIGVIVCEANMDDMSGEEFRSVVMEEMKEDGVPVFILPDTEMLAGHSTLNVAAPAGPEVLRQILQVAGANPQQFPIPLNPDLPAQLQGDLGQFALADFLNWVAEMRFHGHWLITVSDDAKDKRTAHLYMENGNVVYAEYAGLTGKGAVFNLLRSINTYPQTTFTFYKTDYLLNLQSADLKKSTQRLLMELAVDIDHLSSHQAQGLMN